MKGSSMRKEKAVVKFSLKWRIDFLETSLNFLEEVQPKDYNVDHVEENTINAPFWVGRIHTKTNYPRRCTKGPPEKYQKL